jgi:hypothetical protein
MSTTATIPVFDPQGVLRDVPQDQLKAAVDAGGKPSVRFQAPDGKIRYVPANMTADAVKAGGKMLPIEQQDIQQPGLWHAIASDAVGFAKSILNAGPEMANGDQMHEDAAYQQKLINEGHSAPYRALMSLTPNGMRESAESGDVGGVAGHTVVPAAAAASPLAAEGMSRAAGSVSAKVSPVTKAAVGAAPDAVAAAVKKLPVSVIRNVPWIGDVLNDMYKAGAEAYRNAKPPADKGAPLPETPPTEVLQASSLARGPQPVVDPAQGLGKIPARYTPPASESAAKSVAIPPKIKPSVVEQQLEESLGGQKLVPGVPLRNQAAAQAAEAASKLPAGFKPVESAAIKGYKYDPDKLEFESITQGGQHYIHGDVTPEQVEKFEASDSKGKAWSELRNAPGVTPVAKVINGKRISTIPVRRIDPEEEAASEPPSKKPPATAEDLSAILQESLKQARAKRAGQ